MALSADEIDLVLAELAPRLDGARLQEVRVPAPDRVVLSARAPGDTIHLLVVVQSVHARLHPVDRPPPNPRPALAVQGALRATLRGPLTGLTRDEGDRVVRLRIGDRTLLAELTGRHGNLFILGPDGRIEIALRPNRSHKRDLRPGLPWTPPASALPSPRPPRFAPPGAPEQVAAWYAEREQRDALDERRTATLKQLRTLRKRLVRKAGRQRREADRGEEVAAWRREADLLGARFHELRPGMDAITVEDWFEPGSPPRTIRLDPACSPREEVDRRYKTARRLERGARRAAEELARTEAEQGRLEAALDALEAATGLDDLEQAIDALPPRWRSRARPRRAAKAERLPYHRYHLPGGGAVLVGRSSRDNDALTFRHARGRDAWLHVVGRPGAHVVIPLDGPGPEPAALEAAAQLALAHSGFREGDDGEVAWTRVKHVRKVKGAPGKVTYTQEKVLRVRRDRGALAGVEREEEAG